MKIIKFLSLKLQNYKSHRDLSVEFGDLTKIIGDNAQGKSSIIEAITWLLYGTDTLGSKLDPSPITYDFDEVKVELLLSVDDTQVLLGRGLVKGKAQYYINEVPKKAGDFNEILEQLFDKELFLSLFNPNYFFTMHWEKQRSMLLQYVTAPSNKEVFKDLPEAQSSKLAELVKKHSLDDLQKIHKANKTKMEKDHIAAQSRTKTLQEQLSNISKLDDIMQAQQERDKLELLIKEIEKSTISADENNRKISDLQSRIGSLKEQISASAAKWPSLRDEVIQENCRTCGQSLDDTSITNVKADKEKRIEAYRSNHEALVTKRKDLEKELSELTVIDVSEQLQKIRELDIKLQAILESIRNYKQHEQLHTQIEQAKKSEEDKLTSLKESIFIIDAIKDFRAKEAELQGNKVQELFDTLSIRLFEELKNGEIKATFEIEMDGKPYSKLSLSESIRAGLELREVLSDQSSIVAPVFVDNAESITKLPNPSGQFILAGVVEGLGLEIIRGGNE